eukprot:scaffold21598_cov107-Isochrysis_galbana.AAC.3
MASHELASRRVRVLPLQLVLCAAAVSANVYEYNSQPLEPNVIQYRRVGMWTKAEAPAHVGDGRSQVELDVRLARPAPAGAGLVQVLVFHSSELGIIGVHGADGSRTLCCTSELIQMGACSREGSVVVRGDGEGDEEQPGVWLRDMEFNPGQATASLSAEVQVARSGVHYLLFSSCMSQTGQRSPPSPPPSLAHGPPGRASGATPHLRRRHCWARRTRRSPHALPNRTRLISLCTTHVVASSQARRPSRARIDVVASSPRPPTSATHHTPLFPPRVGDSATLAIHPPEVRSLALHPPLHPPLQTPHCPSVAHTGTVLLSGRTAWFNPHGYLPAELYAFLPFFKVMTLAYVGLGLVWAGMCFHYRAVLLPLQTYIGGVILLGAAESVSRLPEREDCSTSLPRSPRSPPSPPTPKSAQVPPHTRTFHTHQQPHTHTHTLPASGHLVPGLLLLQPRRRPRRLGCGDGRAGVDPEEDRLARAGAGGRAGLRSGQTHAR